MDTTWLEKTLSGNIAATILEAPEVIGYIVRDTLQLIDAYKELKTKLADLIAQVQSETFEPTQSVAFLSAFKEEDADSVYCQSFCTMESARNLPPGVFRNVYDSIKLHSMKWKDRK